MEPLIEAFRNSARAFRRLVGTERAFRQEMALLAAATPLAWLLAVSWRDFALLIGVLLFVIVVEVLNTGIEAACDAVGEEFDANIQLAKDCGSLAVLIAIFIALGAWVGVIAGRLFASG